MPALIDRIPAIVYVVAPDAARSMLWASRQVEPLLGFAQAEWLADPGLWSRRLHAADRDRVLAQFARVAETGERFHCEYRLIAKDARVRWLLDEAAPMRDAAGALRCFEGVMHDVTERREAEEGRARLQEEQRYAEVMAALGSLVAGMAHEVRNPLFGMTATIDALDARLGPDSPWASYLKVLRAEASRLAELVRDLIEYGRPGQPDVVPCSIQSVVAAAAQGCVALAEQSGVEIATCASHERAGAAERPVPLVEADPPRLRLALQNLLANAIQHSPAGERVTVTVQPARPGDSSWVECRVEDRGPGFAAEDLPRIFDPFFSRRRGGTGLGLAIVRRIVEEQGGVVLAANRPQGGAVVTVRLPAARGLAVSS